MGGLFHIYNNLASISFADKLPGISVRHQTILKYPKPSHTAHAMSCKFSTSLYFDILLFSEGKVTGRGCSTQKPNFKTCDTHKYGKKKSEKYCYCTEDFCNTSPIVAPNTTLLALLVIAQCSNSAYLIVVQLLAVLLHTCRHCHLIFCNLRCQIARFLTCQITRLLSCQSQHVRSGDINLNEHVTNYERNCSPNLRSDHSYNV